MNTWTIRLILANVVMFALSALSPGLLSATMLVPAESLVRPWTLITYMFMHAGFSHILFNMLGLYFFGPRLEAEMGGKRFLWLYFISGLTGGFLSFFFTPHSPIVGASGAVYGVLLGFAYFWPREKIFLWGVLPIESRWLVVGMTLLSLFGGFGGDGSNIAHFAHLGGFLGAFVYLRWLEKRSPQALMMKTMAPPAPGRGAADRWAKINRESLHEVNRTELDRIREKMSTQGVASLTAMEIDFLERFSRDL